MLHHLAGTSRWRWIGVSGWAHPRSRGTHSIMGQPMTQTPQGRHTLLHTSYTQASLFFFFWAQLHGLILWQGISWGLSCKLVCTNGVTPIPSRKIWIRQWERSNVLNFICLLNKNAFSMPTWSRGDHKTLVNQSLPEMIEHWVALARHVLPLECVCFGSVQPGSGAFAVAPNCRSVLAEIEKIRQFESFWSGSPDTQGCALQALRKTSKTLQEIDALLEKWTSQWSPTLCVQSHHQHNIYCRIFLRHYKVQLANQSHEYHFISYINSFKNKVATVHELS